MAAPRTTRIRELVVRTQDGNSRSIRLEGGRLSVGRSSANELCFAEDGGLSRQHLALERDADDWVVRDLGSKNGTLVNGVRLAAPQRLKPGDRITAGHLVMEFDPAAGLAKETVVFIETGEHPTPSASTVITSLEGVMQDSGGIAPRPGFDPTPHMRALIRAGRELSENRPLSEMFDVILKLGVEAVGGARGVLMTLENDHLQVRSALGEGFRISTAVRDKVLTEKASMLVRDTSTDEMLKERMSIVEQRVRSMMAVPLQTNDRVIGLIYVDQPHFIREFAKEDLNLLTVLANVAAIRIEHQRLAEVEQVERMHAKELEQAADIQRRLLPTRVPAVEGLDIAGHNSACRGVGGDYYDFFKYPDGRLALLVGDVAGKGMPAALMMSSLQARVQVLAEENLDVATLVARLNRTIATNCPSNRFITFFFGLVDPATGEVCYTNAGHNPPLLVRRSGEVERLEGGGMILGILAKAGYEQRSARLDPGDILVLFSDGVTEATPADRDEEFGEERLAEVLRAHAAEPTSAIIASVLQSLNDWSQGAPPADDVTLVIARRLA